MTLHTLSVLVENKPGVLTRVSALFARRSFNISSLAVGPTESDAVSRITVVVEVETPATGLELSQRLSELPCILGIDTRGSTLNIDVGNVAADGRTLLAFLGGADIAIRAYHVMEPSLENLYLDVVA
jgi:acetolactate synthase-1/3 small subunit